MEKPVELEEFGMRLIRGQLYEGGLRPAKDLALQYELHTADTLGDGGAALSREMERRG